MQYICENAKNCKADCAHKEPHSEMALCHNTDCDDSPLKKTRCITVNTLSEHLTVEDAQELIKKANEAEYKTQEEIAAYCYEAGFTAAEEER